MMTELTHLSRALQSADNAITGMQEKWYTCCMNALRDHDPDTARRILERVDALENFRHQVKQVRDAWRSHKKTLLPPEPVSDSEPEPGRPGTSVHRGNDRKTAGQKRNFFGKVPKGTYTTPEEFEPYVIRALIALEGSSGPLKVIAKIEPEVQSILTDNDKELLKSNGEPRWYNTVRTAGGVNLKKKGILRRDLPRGRWVLHSWDAAFNLLKQ